MRIWLLLVLFAHLAVGQNTSGEKHKKIHGVSWVASGSKPTADVMKSVEEASVNWLCLMPYGFSSNDDPNLRFNSERQWVGETSEGIRHCTSMAHDLGYSVAIKPHIWLFNGAYTGHWSFDTEEDWATLEASYTKYIITFAEIAEDEGAELFILGTELEKFVEQRPDYWFDLIDSVRAVYSGMVTYAANWDEYDHVPFWKELDYIGIDAYFPLTDNPKATAEKIRKIWLKQYAVIDGFANEVERPVLFTEYGYRSVYGGFTEPWDSSRRKEYDIATQLNGYIGLYNAVWQQKSFAGGFLWKWFDRPESAGGTGHTGFTPQNKPSLEVIRDYFTDAIEP
ncbi:glycoside hydrolase [Cryomorphaceae bacterium]|nr:glycoside hydrolase [Cryomorphaceae bacterium]